MTEILEVGLKEMLDNPLTMFTYWFVTGKCNFKCDYCDVYDNKIEPWSTKEKIIEFLNYFGTIRNHKVLLYGGEPTLDPDFFKIVKNIEDDIRLFTNLSQPIDFLIRLADIRKDITVSVSYHLQKADYHDILRKITFLCEHHFKKVRLKIMADSRFKDESINLYNTFKTLDVFDNFEIYIDLVMPNSQGNLGAEWSKDDLEWFLPIQDHKTLRLKYLEDGIVKTKDVSWNEMRTTMLDSNNYYRCGAGGKNLLYIDSNSDVLPCKSHLTPLFNLVEDNFRDNLDKISNDGIICSHMGFCCETDFPKKLVCKRRVSKQRKNIRNRLL